MKSALLNYRTFRIISVILLIVYAIILLVSYEKRSAHWIGISSVTVVLGLISYAMCIYAGKNYLETSEGKSCETTAERRWFWVLLGSCVLAYCALALFASTAWLKMDDFTFMDMGRTLGEKWKEASNRYSSWVSRFGDFVVYFFPLTRSRWEVWLVNPALLVSLPFALWRLLRRSRGESMAGSKGVIFFWFSLFLIVLSIATMRSFWDFAASTNYLWPSVGFVWLISLYNPVNWQVGRKQQQLLCLGALVLGLICGWGIECTAVTIVPLLFLWVGYNCWKKVKLPLFCWSGLLGAMWGVFILFSSPALARRLAAISKSRPLDVYSLTPEQIDHFVRNLNWEQVNLLKGQASNISLHGIPLLKHAYFLPFLNERFWGLACYAVVMFGLLALCFLASKASKARLKQVGISLSVLILGYGMGLSYIVQSIPTAMSFVPASMTCAIACIILFYFLQEDEVTWSPKCLVATILAAFLCLSVYFPVGAEALRYTSYRDAQLAEIDAQIAAGKKHIVLPCPWPLPPRDRLGLIGRRNIRENPEEYVNMRAAQAFRVKKISQKKYK